MPQMLIHLMLPLVGDFSAGSSENLCEIFLIVHLFTLLFLLKFLKEQGRSQVFHGESWSEINFYKVHQTIN